MFYIVIFILGLVFGSFYTVVGERLPKKESIIKPASHCPHCLRKLSWYELIPVFSYIFLRGKCHHCGKKIPLMYLILELLCGILFLLSYIIFGISFEFFGLLIISSLLIIIWVSDFKYNIILDSPLIISVILYIILELIYKDIKTVILSICFGTTMFVILFLIKVLGDLIFKKESLGGGDIKLGFVMGLILTPRVSLIALIFASILALIYVFIAGIKKEKEIPYGPFLLVAFYVCFIFKDIILEILNHGF